MPKFFRLLRSQKRRSSSTPSSPLGKKKMDGIFRSTTSSEKSTKRTTTAPPVIEAAITYSLSEDEESCDIDIENQFSVGDFKKEHINDDITFEEGTVGAVATKEIAHVATVNSLASKTNHSCTVVKENDKIMTFTHLEIMRNELAHMMQIGKKENEIFQLKRDAEEIKIQHAEIVASKDATIAMIESAFTEVKSDLSLAENKLVFEEKEHSKTINLLMQTQCDYHELNAKSWYQPMFSYF